VNYPSDSPLRADATRVLPLDHWHRSRGGRMVEFAGYWMPVQYEGIIAEHLWTRAHAGLFDVSHMGQLTVSGPGAAAALEALMPGDFAALQPERMRYSLLLDVNGGILDDLMVTRWDDHFGLVANGATKWDDIALLRRSLPAGVTLEHLESHALLALQGPDAAAALAELGIAAGALSFMEAGRFLWDQVPLIISRSGYTGEDGFEISVAAEHAEALADALCALETVKPVGLGARASLRLEAGLPLYGHDLGPETGPVEAGLAFAVSKRRRAEGGFPGAAHVLAALVDGPQRRRVGLILQGRMAAREGAVVLLEGRIIGKVTSGGFSPSLERPIAMATLEAAHAAIGTHVSIDARGRMLTAAITAMPFIPHRYVRKGAA
jgi:aminomethyltransferase